MRRQGSPKREWSWSGAQPSPSEEGESTVAREGTMDEIVWVWYIVDDPHLPYPKRGNNLKRENMTRNKYIAAKVSCPGSHRMGWGSGMGSGVWGLGCFGGKRFLHDWASERRSRRATAWKRLVRTSRILLVFMKYGNP